MCNVTISLLELFRKYPDAESARKYFEDRKWSNGVYCPHCNEVEKITKRKMVTIAVIPARKILL